MKKNSNFYPDSGPDSGTLFLCAEHLRHPGVLYAFFFLKAVRQKVMEGCKEIGV